MPGAGWCCRRASLPVLCPLSRPPAAVVLAHCACPWCTQGDYDVRVVARDTQGVELMCVDVHFEMLPPSFVQKLLPGAWLGKQSSGSKGGQAQRIAEAMPAVARRLLQAMRRQ